MWSVHFAFQERSSFRRRRVYPSFDEMCMRLSNGALLDSSVVCPRLLRNNCEGLAARQASYLSDVDPSRLPFHVGRHHFSSVGIIERFAQEEFIGGNPPMLVGPNERTCCYPENQHYGLFDHVASNILGALHFAYFSMFRFGICMCVLVVLRLHSCLSKFSCVCLCPTIAINILTRITIGSASVPARMPCHVVSCRCARMLSWRCVAHVGAMERS